MKNKIPHTITIEVYFGIDDDTNEIIWDLDGMNEDYQTKIDQLISGDYDITEYIY